MSRGGVKRARGTDQVCAPGRTHLRGVATELKEDVFDVALNVPRLEKGIYPSVPDLRGMAELRVR
jgi:hypothetical protein